MQIKTEVEPYVVVLRRRVWVARQRLKDNPKDVWAKGVIDECNDYLYNRTIQVPWLPEPLPKVRADSIAAFHRRVKLVLTSYLDSADSAPDDLGKHGAGGHRGEPTESAST